MKKNFGEKRLNQSLGFLFIAGLIIIAALTAPCSAQRKSYSVLYSFQGTPDGQDPTGPLLYVSGKLYGTTSVGGMWGHGTVFELNALGNESVLFSFKRRVPDGLLPNPRLIEGTDGALYGTTSAGGAYDGGVIFRLDRNDKETLLHSFGDGTDGYAPYAGVIRDKAGNLYGTTQGGGLFGEHCNYLGCGTVYEMNPNGYESVLYGFTGGADGGDPFAGLILGPDGDLFGATYGGGNTQACDLGCGTIFELDKTGKETALHAFDVSDGANPNNVVVDKMGNLYGTTAQGGCHGLGTVFEFDKAGKFKIVHCFAGGRNDGSAAGYLLLGPGAVLYGTAALGGGGPCYLRSGKRVGCGIVFKLDKRGKETILHRFQAGTDGVSPYGLAIDAEGNLYGIASAGGDINCNAPYGCGLVFKIKP